MSNLRLWSDNKSYDDIDLEAHKDTETVINNLMVFNVTYLAHRLAWLYVNGSFPALEIDHIDGNWENNRIINLRDVTRTENGMNKRKPVTNKSGVIGVHWHKRQKKWVAAIKVDQKTRHLGSYNTVK